MRSTRTIKMKKMSVISVIENRSFAFVKGNRPTNSKAVTAKMKSIEEYGLLSPITVVDGEQVITSGGHLVDLNGKDIPDSQSVNYYAVLDGQHRLIAYIKLGLNLNDLVITEPLNVDCRNEYLHDHVERNGLYGRTCHDALQDERRF